MSVQCRGRKFAVKRESGVSPERSGHCKQGVLPYYAIGSIHLAQTTGPQCFGVPVVTVISMLLRRRGGTKICKSGNLLYQNYRRNASGESVPVIIT